MDEANKKMDKSPREGIGIRDPLILTLKNPSKTLKWK